MKIPLVTKPVARSLRAWIKSRDTPAAAALYAVGMAVRRMQIPSIYMVHKPLYLLDRGLRQFFANALRIGWYTPLFQTRLTRPAPALRIWGGIPHVMGDLTIDVGRNVVFFGRNALMGRTAPGSMPSLTIGDNTEIGFQTIISVGRRIEIGNHVLIGIGCHLIGYPGHPLDPDARARNEPDLDSQVGDIVLEDGVWLATGVRVLGGVRIGRGTVVGAGSIVTKDLPAGVIAAGIPARPIKTLAEAGVATA